jgi:hypothetical protein
VIKQLGEYGEIQMQPVSLLVVDDASPARQVSACLHAAGRIEFGVCALMRSLSERLRRPDEHTKARIDLSVPVPSVSSPRQLPAWLLHAVIKNQRPPPGRVKLSS